MSLIPTEPLPAAAPLPNARPRSVPAGAQILAISSAWPPMADGTGYALRSMLAGMENVVAIVPDVAESGGVRDAGVTVVRRLRFGGRVGGPLKLMTLLRHAELLLAPLRYCLRRRHRRPSVVVCSQPLFAGLAGLITKLAFGIPYVVLGLGEEFTAISRDRAAFRLRDRLMRLTLRHTAAVVCITENTRRLVAGLYGVPEKLLYVIHPSVNVGELDLLPAAPELTAFRRRLVPRGRLLLMTGRLAQRHKGFDVAIEALPDVLAAEPETYLVIAGPGDQAELRALAERVGVSERVRFAGMVERSELLALYACCDLFLMPGRELDGSAEGFGIVLLEAALFGKPTVAGQVGGMPEAVVDTETGLLVDGRSSADVAGAILRLLRDPALANRLGDGGRERVLREFDGRVQRAQFARVVQDAIARSRASSES